MNAKQQCHQLHTAIFNEKNIGELYPLLHQLYSLYSDKSGIGADHTLHQDINLPSGKAISTFGAAQCLLEIGRTSKFLQGIRQAILQLREQFKEPVKILYAGCGPFATLATPLTAIFSSDEINFELLDINPASLAAVEKLYGELELSAYVSSYTLADATRYQIPNDRRPHLIIAETLNAALKNEPQVELTLNLVPQLLEKGIFIPQSIAVDAYLLDFGKETTSAFVGAEQPRRWFLGNVYTLSQTQCERHLPNTIRIPEDRGHNDQLNLLTEITVFGDQKLAIYDCSLTLPQKVCKVDDKLKQAEVQFEYRQGKKPKFEYQLITAD